MRTPCFITALWALAVCLPLSACTHGKTVSHHGGISSGNSRTGFYGGSAPYSGATPYNGGGRTASTWAELKNRPELTQNSNNLQLQNETHQYRRKHAVRHSPARRTKTRHIPQKTSIEHETEIQNRVQPKIETTDWEAQRRRALEALKY